MKSRCGRVPGRGIVSALNTMKSFLVLRRFPVVALSAWLLATSVPAASLVVGDPAPMLQTGKWVQGEPVERFDSNHVYVVEFWAT